MFQRNHDVVTIGGATRDIMFYSDAGVVVSNPSDLLRQKLLGFEYGAKVTPLSLCFTMGGGACNTAVSFARLGLKVASFIRLGLDRDGDAIQSELTDEKVNTKFIERDTKDRTGISFIIIHQPGNEHIAFLHRGANNNMKMTLTELSRARTKWFYVSSLTGTYWRETLRNLAKYLAKNSKKKLAWNPGETQLKKGRRGLSFLLKQTEVLILNKDEATELVYSDKGKMPGINNPWTLLKTLISWGPKVVVITNGDRGAYAYDGKTLFREPAIKKKAVNTTGAGDAFGSTFIAGLKMFKGDITKSLRIASVNSSAVITTTGPQEGLMSIKHMKASMKNYIKG
ncbi:carbohydrate kinase family protein [Patescibacteria group bacterium]|nr:carbohydrate kinase family protein [Patescibacteria group bacterium]MBU1889882.1 carbohydrate kinase family protein [Patescibacteria group bacterium]